MLKRVLVIGLAVATLAACGDTDGDGDLDADPIAAAQHKVDQAHLALDEANQAFDEASDAFCKDGADYVAAVDRYGKVFTDGEATVGDVTAAGDDLERPRDQAADSADDLQQAQDDVTSAEQDLADAEAALAKAKTGTTAAPDSTTTTIVAPLVPEDTLARAKQAEADLKAAFEGIDASTTLTDATQDVNAAATAVEVASVQVLATAGCLSDEKQQQTVVAVGQYTKALQSALTTAGYYSGEVDGIYGPGTVDAVTALQKAAGLPETGLVDKATADALDKAVTDAGGDAAAADLAHTAALQTVLTVTGHWTGPIDGKWTDALTAALKDLQADLGVEATGVVDPATIAAAQAALEAAQNPTTTSTTTPDDSTTTSTTTGG